MRQIYTVNAVQIVVSEAHPEGVFSVLPGYPKRFDSRNYNATDENPDVLRIQEQGSRCVLYGKRILQEAVPGIGRADPEHDTDAGTGTRAGA